MVTNVKTCGLYTARKENEACVCDVGRDSECERRQVGLHSQLERLQESGSISSQKPRRSQCHDGETCSKIISWGLSVTLSGERSKYQYVSRIPREPPTLFEHLERGQRKTFTVSEHARRQRLRMATVWRRRTEGRRSAPFVGMTVRWIRQEPWR